MDRGRPDIGGRDGNTGGVWCIYPPSPPKGYRQIGPPVHAPCHAASVTIALIGLGAVHGIEDRSRNASGVVTWASQLGSIGSNRGSIGTSVLGNGHRSCGVCFREPS
jgi:hypothetical protein